MISLPWPWTTFNARLMTSRSSGSAFEVTGDDPPAVAEVEPENARWLGEASKASLILLSGTPWMAMSWALVSWAMK